MLSTAADPHARNVVGRVVAVVQGVALLLALTLDLFGAVPAWVPDVLLLGALAALCWSFGRQGALAGASGAGGDQLTLSEG